MAPLRIVSDDTFRSHVLAAPHPVITLFASRICAASQALATLLTMLIVEQGETIGGVRIDIDDSSELAEQYGVAATPTLLIFTYGDVRTRIVGFVPRGLLAVLVAQVRQGTLPPDPYWSPRETLVEDTLILPLLTAAGLHYQRQVTCPLAPDDVRSRGRIDVLVFRHPQAPPGTLIESKRRLHTRHDLQRATDQALGYARALKLPAFAVAAPPGLWLFRRAGDHAIPMQALTSLMITDQPDLASAALRQLLPSDV